MPKRADVRELNPDARLLIVDDLVGNISLLRNILNRLGFTQIDTSTDSRETLARVEEFRPDLIILDLNMPHGKRPIRPELAVDLATTDRRAQILNCLVEGNSIRATARLTGAAINTVVKMLCEAGRAFSAYQDEKMRNLTCKRIQCDEIWAFVGCKEKNATAGHKEKGWGDVWTWAAIDADTKLIPCWYIGTRDGGAAYHFIHDLKARLANACN
jgi:CheY-like chemotaxis protein